MYSKYKCKECNSKLQFSTIENRKLICKNCNSVFTLDQFGKQLKLKEILENGLTLEELKNK